MKLHPLYLLLGVVYVFLGQGVVFFTYLIVVVLHEFAHKAIAKKLKVDCSGITLYPYGGEIKLNYINLNSKDEFAISIAGPTLNLLLGAMCAGVWWFFPESYYFLELFFYANIFTGILNLIPLYPFDGGRILVAILKTKISKSLSMKIAKIAGIIFGAILFIFGIFIAVMTKNISFVILSVFIFLSNLEIKSANFTKNLLSIQKDGEFKRKGLKKVNLLVPQNLLIFELVKMLDDKAFYYFDIADENYRIKKTIDENELYEIAISNDVYLPINSVIK